MAYTPSSPDNIRLTITVTPEVHATFKRMAETANMSISRAMGDWLGDTLDAAEVVVGMMEKARAAPKLAIREMHQFALGLSDETGEMLENIRRKSRELAPVTTPDRARSRAAATGSPRPVIRGVKSQPTTKPAAKRRAS